MAVSAAALLLLAVGGSSPPPVPSNATLYFKVGPPLSEIEPLELFQPFGDQRPTMRGAVAAIRKAKTDSRIKSLVIMPRTTGALWGQVQELRAAVDEFRQAGKPVTAFLEQGGAADYLIASAADRIVMMPAGQLDITGVATYELFFRGALDKLGVFPDLLHIGDYKTASNTFTDRGFTPAHREMSASLNQDWYEQIVTAIAERRGKSADDVRRIIDKGPFLAEEARAEGLIDELGYEDQLDDKAPVQGTRRVADHDYRRSVSTYGTPGEPRIAVLYAVGAITSGESQVDPFGGSVVGSDTFNDWLRKVRLDPAIRAVVIRIDSPGGSAIASEVMWRELMLTREAKPVVVSMGDVAASGGYYIAAPAHHIVAQPGTITGSIGVVTGKFVLEGTFDKLGIGTDAVSHGRMAQIYSPFTPFSKDERARVAEQMQATYDLFVSRVAEGRKSTTAKIDAVAQGRVWTGRQARDLGLVDELGGLTTAIQAAKQRARLDMTKDVSLVVYPPKRSVFDALTNPFGMSAPGPGSWLADRPDARALHALMRLPQLFRRGEPLAIMPNVFWR